MLSHRKAQALKDLQAKDKQITELEWRLEAQAAKSSLLQERLTATLDAMDTLRLTHERELSEERQAKENAREKLQRFMEYASSIEQERDECRDALLAVIEKEPIEQSDQPVEAATGAIEANPQLIVASLRAELEKERVSHTQTHKQAEAEILSLRAQLAQREAELEACETHKDHAALLASSLGAEAPTSSPREVEADGVSATPLTSQAVMEILAIRAAKNRELETEIKNLTSKLLQIRQTSGPVPRTESPAARPVQLPPKSPDLRPYSPNDILSPYTMTPRHSSTPYAGKGASHLHLRRTDELPEGPVKTALTEMQKLEEQVRILVEGIDGLGEQRRLTREAIEESAVEAADTSSPTAPPYIEEDTSSQNTAVHGKTSPPQVEVDQDDVAAALRAELKQTRLQASQREAELLEEITRLQEALSNIPQPASPVIGDLLDDGNAELPMDLGTPLAPVAVLWHSEGGAAITITNERPQGPQTLIAASDAAMKLGADAIHEEPKPDAGSTLANAGIAEPGRDDPEEDDLSLQIPLPPSPVSDDENGEAPIRPQLRAVRDRPPTPFASFAVSATDSGATADEEAPGDDEGAGEPTLDSTTPDYTAGEAPPSRRRDYTCTDRLEVLERELETTKRAVTQRDEEIVELRKLVQELRVAMLGR